MPSTTFLTKNNRRGPTNHGRGGLNRVVTALSFHNRTVTGEWWKDGNSSQNEKQEISKTGGENLEKRVGSWVLTQMGSAEPTRMRIMKEAENGLRVVCFGPELFAEAIACDMFKWTCDV